jgi:hypothetical protein
MALLKFRIYWEEDEGTYRDVVIHHKQNFEQLHVAILKSYEFDSKHQATFYRSNDFWQRGREISFEKYDKPYKAEPLIMRDTMIGSEIKDTNQRFIYVYDFTKEWTFLIELIQVIKEDNADKDYPAIVRKEGLGPSQYGTKDMVASRLADMEEKYDLKEGEEGFGEEGDEDDLNNEEDTGSSEESSDEF